MGSAGQPEPPNEPLHDPSGWGGGQHSINGFRLLRRIGNGAMSSVYVAYDPLELRTVAIKLLADHLAGDKLFVNRFYREARLSVALNHAHIVRGHSFGHDPNTDRHFLVMEHVDGPDAMTRLLTHGPFPIPAAVRVGISVGQALQAMHAANLVHRDVKPDNILLGPNGEAKLADLGLAKRRTGDLDLTTVHQGVGTPHYMPYEQAVNAEFVDGRSDLFALGATLYHLLTGRVPFSGDTHEEIVHRKSKGDYLPAREYRPDLPPVLDVILAKALARDPHERFAEVTEWIAALAATGLAGIDTSPPTVRPPAADPDDRPLARTRADLAIIECPLPTPATAQARSSPAIRNVPASSSPPSGNYFGWSVIVTAVVAAVLAFGGLRTALWPDGTAAHTEPHDTAVNPTPPPTDTQ